MGQAIKRGRIKAGPFMKEELFLLFYPRFVGKKSSFCKQITPGVGIYPTLFQKISQDTLCTNQNKRGNV